MTSYSTNDSDAYPEARNTPFVPKQPFQQIFNNIHDALFIHDPEGTILDVNQAALDLFQVTKEEILRLSISNDLSSPECNLHSLDELWKNTLQGMPQEIEWKARRPRDGTVFDVDVHLKKIAFEEGDVILANVRDISQQKRTEENLRASETQYRQLFEESLSGFALHEIILNEKGEPFDYRYLAINSTFENLTGLKAANVIGKTVREILPGLEPVWIDTYGKVALTGEPAQFEDYVKTFDKHFEVRAFSPKKGQFAVTFHDITQRKQAEGQQKKLEEQLRQSQKMEAVGQLAGGIAHDFNNLLQAVNGYAEMALPELEGSPVYEMVEEIVKAGKRAATLVSQLLAFSRRQVLKLENADLNGIISDLLKMVRRVIGEHIQVDFLPGHQLGTVRADRGQIEQVIMNLCVNARDAMADHGTLTLETENVYFDQNYCGNHQWAEPGRYVLLSITDTGCGIEAGILEKIFEPFYTTKEVGKGTGLGLATVYGIIRQHNGMIQAYSEPGKGTTFKIYLPMIERDASAVGSKVHGEAPGGSETILIAEDDELVRKLGVKVLERAGFTVVVACNGQEALHVCQEYHGRIDLALLDVVMPEMGGKGVYNQLKETYPDMRFLFCSGYSQNAIHTNFVLDDGFDLIQKPFSPNDLLFKIREVLDCSD